ncbi:pyrroline-5-carboxylate reductase [Lignipirellula cremea]|uniref:Pyrroline-5-carboxylate reductase n=1 Tax=Lignipirellula cremea TaxID=2528010 RepID=A0A518E133_9BACT|nr:pyrroline-5-carboxylate reductase [Lignipirellula cremea]QDU97805.1 Pyrroline-5-carboxylate reductase [Lignipirellula cremea]
MISQRIGFIGGGQMGQALARGFLQSGLTAGEQLAVCDPSAAAVEQFQSQAPGAVVCADKAELAARSEVIVLAVKPQYMPQVLKELAALPTEDCLVMSIAAGVTLAVLEKDSGAQRVIRVMPNTPCLVGQGAAGFAKGSGATAADGQLVQQLLESVGIAFELPETLLDAVTGLSGSGPAFVYAMIEALSDGGVRMGLPRHVAAQLAAQTVAGAAAMVLETGEHPAVLKDRVASPGGTTIAGLQTLEDYRVRAGLIASVQSATLRSQELGRS